PGHVAAALTAVEHADMPRTVMIDASHDNSRKDHARQAVVAQEIADQIRDGQRGIAGVMIESFLVAGRQDLVGPGALTYGQSVTDACRGWEATADVLDGLADAVRKRAGLQRRDQESTRRRKLRRPMVRNATANASTTG